jgi:hypothetical protein
MYQLNNCSLMLHKLNTIMSQGLDHRTGIEESVMLRNLMESIAEPLATWGHKFLQECQPMRKHLTGFLEHHLERLDGSTYSVEKTRRQCLECKGNKFAHTIFSRTVFDRIHTLSPDLMSKIHDNLKTWWDIYRCTFGVRETLIYLPVE